VFLLALTSCADRVEELQAFCDTLDVDGDGWLARDVEGRCCYELKTYSYYRESYCAPTLVFDCNDDDATIFPDTIDPAYDGIDSDCDGVDGFWPMVNRDRCVAVLYDANENREVRMCCLSGTCEATTDGSDLPEVTESCDDVGEPFDYFVGLCRQIAR
jgi:hypothetical protein